MVNGAVDFFCALLENLKLFLVGMGTSPSQLPSNNQCLGCAQIVLSTRQHWVARQGAIEGQGTTNVKTEPASRWETVGYGKTFGSWAAFARWAMGIFEREDYEYHVQKAGGRHDFSPPKIHLFRCFGDEHQWVKLADDSSPFMPDVGFSKVLLIYNTQSQLEKKVVLAIRADIA